MAVFKRAGSPYYYYEFQAHGQRVCRSSKKTSEREAKKVEARARADLEEAVRRKRSGEPHVTVEQMALGVAGKQFWDEKGQHEAGCADVWAQLQRLIARLGEDTLLSEIDNRALIGFREVRRKETTQRKKPPANRTINADLELFRRLLNRASKVWSNEQKRIDIGPPRTWDEILLATPKARVRELSADEEKRLFEHLREDYHDITAFVLAAGYRRAALLLPWSAVDLKNGLIRVERKGGEDGDVDILPISKRMRDILERQVGKHSEYVFTYVAKRGHVYLRDRKASLKRNKGDRHPITYQGLASALRVAVRAAGIKNWRLIHDFRHTAATRTLRASGNIMAVKHMLGHRDLASTQIYAHVMTDDVRNAMDSVSPNKAPTNGTREATAEDFGL